MPKDKDLLPLSNAVAQVVFWEKNIDERKANLAKIQQYKNTPNFGEIEKKVLDGIKASEESLEKAKLKLEESNKLE